MNTVTSRQRKIIYALAILILLVPIIYLGSPLSRDVQPGQKTAVAGGRLAQMRHTYELGESTLGDIDPSSAAANLVLLGLRGMAATVLHQNAIVQQDRKEFGRLKTTVESILKLQPHYIEVWKFQGWNLAFNVSSEWDRVDDRFYWVKEGLKFMNRGAQRNKTSTMLIHNVGDFVGRKIGSADESKFYRKFFVDDPAEEIQGADPEINPEAKDNYLVARDFFLTANELDETYPIKGMTREVFRKSPVQALFDYAAAITREGKFEAAAGAWADAYQEWTEGYGNEIFLGLDDVAYKMNSTEEDIVAMAAENGVSVKVQRDVWDRRTKMINYDFWRQLAMCERDPVTIAARRAIYDGKQAYADGDISDSVDADGTQISTAQELFEEGIRKTAEMFEAYPAMEIQDDKVLDAMIAVHYWQEICKHNGRVPPENHPLAEFHAEHVRYLGEALQMFRRETN